MQFIHTDLGFRQKGEIVEITLTSGANVRLSTIDYRRDLMATVPQTTGAIVLTPVKGQLRQMGPQGCYGLSQRHWAAIGWFHKKSNQHNEL